MNAAQRHGTAEDDDMRSPRSLSTADNSRESANGVCSARTAERDDGVVGRDAELAVVSRFVDAVAHGPMALIVRGEPGIGKTTIWNEARARAAAADFAILSCRPGPADAELPYAGLGDLFADVPDEVMAELPPPQRRALDVALLKCDAGSGPLQQRAVSSATLHVLLALARTAPVVLAIDDVQWLDSPTVRVLRFAARRLGPAPVGVLVARRTGLSDDECLQLGDAFPADRVARMVVGPLDLAEIDRLLRSHLHTTFLGKTLRRIQATSGGNPLFAIELGRALLDPDSRSVPGQAFPAPSSLPELLAARLARVPLPASKALLAASALARPTVDLVLAASTGVGIESLNDAAAAGVVTFDGDVIRFTHPLLSSVVYAAALPEERRRVHRRLADLVTDPEERARHQGLSAESPDEAIATSLDLAAGRAAARGAPDAAAVLFEQAADLTPTSSVQDATRRKLDAVDQHIAAGDTARARSLLQGVLSSHSDGICARAYHRLSRVSALEGDMVDAPALLERALQGVHRDLPLRAAIERDLVWCLAQNGEVSTLVERAEAALHTAEASRQPDLIAEALNHLCMATVLTGDELVPDVIDRALALDEHVRTHSGTPHQGIAAGRLPLALTLKWTDNFARARELLESLLREHVDHGDEGALAPVLFHLGELECWAANWTRAADIATESHELGSRAGQAVADRRALTLDAMIACHQGDADTARSLATESLALAEDAGDSPALVRSLASLGVLEMSTGDLEAAVIHLTRATEIEASLGYNPATLRILPDAVEALLTLGRVEDARPLVDDLERHATRFNRPWTRATAARCRGLLAVADGELDEAMRALGTAVHEHDRLPQPFERARTLLILGSLQRRTKQKRKARESLAASLRLFETQGATLWAARAEVELARIAGRATTPLALTPTEEQVATLVGEGRTNREVAASLFMSVKTVEANLTHIYRKLGISSRRELTGHLRAPHSTDDENGSNPG